MAEVTRVGAVVGRVTPGTVAVPTQGDGQAADGSEELFTIGISLFAELSDGRRVTDSASTTRVMNVLHASLIPRLRAKEVAASQRPSETEVREQVLDMLADESARERWAVIGRALRRKGVHVTARKLDHSPLQIEFTQDLLERLAR
jgi:hypothetical protein